jgi:hypothetical protein
MLAILGLIGLAFSLFYLNLRIPVVLVFLVGLLVAAGVAYVILQVLLWLKIIGPE